MKTKQDFPSINERPPEGIKDDGSKVKVLIVDDSMFVAKQLGQILAKAMKSSQLPLTERKAWISTRNSIQMLTL